MLDKSYKYSIILNMRNILLKISFSGKNYHGWQVQKNALSVQDVFQEALKKVLNEENTEIKGCSRTDVGVHANEYFLSFKTNRCISTARLPVALNHFLPRDISAIDAMEVPDDFHARYSCKGKEYIYKIWNNRIRNSFLDGYVFHYWYSIDIDFLNECAAYFIGTHNFASFCTLDRRNPKNLIRNVLDFDVYKKGNLVIFRVKANGFLYNMVRIMVGTLLKFNKNKIAPSKILDIIMKKDRSKAGPTAVACGLYLNKVFYENLDF